MPENTITLLGCGDVGPLHAPVGPFSALVRSTLATAEIRFAQVERLYSNRGTLQLQADVSNGRLEPHMASVFSDCGFNVASVASNHAMDWGEDALMDTIGCLQALGIKTVGAGRNLEEARRPAIIEAKGVRVAVLAYCSILHEGYAATRDKAGVAPLRVDTYYQAIESQPGMPPRVVTVPHPEDLANIVEDVKEAKRAADVVVLSLHWGTHFIPRLIAEYQPFTATVAFDAGADIILGHHPHVPKGIGVHQGKACFYSLSNFIMSRPAKTPDEITSFERRYGVRMDPDYPLMPWGEDAKRSLMAKAIISAKGIQKVSFLPVLIDKQLRPEILKHGDPRFGDALRYMESASENLDHRFVVEGSEVLVAGGPIAREPSTH